MLTAIMTARRQLDFWEDCLYIETAMLSQHPLHLEMPSEVQQISNLTNLELEA